MMTTSNYAMQELRRRRNACDLLAIEREERDPLGALEAERDSALLASVLELLEAENEREKVLGFLNHATAMVLLWLENERPMLEAVTHAVRAARVAKVEAPAVWIGDELRKLIERRPAMLLITEGPNPADMGHAADLLNAALDSVAWRELGEHFLATLADSSPTTSAGAS